MADKAITELVAAEDIGATDLFVLQQNNTAKKLPGQVLLNWLTRAADGHGGIQSIVKKSTSGLVDTYRITLADTTTFDFVVTNGRSVESIAKVSTSGLVDTYQISYNGGASSTFTVTNGAKGDKGDNAYIWVKYASQKPTASSHSFGDLPDAWIGVYFGTASTAPTDWQAYTWYQWKGEKGDTGEPAVLVSSSVEYQVSDSGTIIPSGAWSASIPIVPQGRYLWTRTTKTFNSGLPVVSYSISRMGLDGSGSVSSVANISPDEHGNVPLTAADVGALPSTGGDLTGALRMNGQPISGLIEPTKNDHAANMGFVNSVAAPYNYAHNSDFTKFVAQAGIGGKHSKTAYYAGDRWILDSGTVTGAARADGNGYTNITLNGTIRQIVENAPDVGTAAIEMVSGTAEISYANGAITITSNGGVIKNVRLFKGNWNADNMAAYQPKDYGAELAECLRYYFQVGKVTPYMSGGLGSATSAYVAIYTPVEMRLVPSAIADGAEFGVRTIDGTRNANYTSVYSRRQNCVLINITLTASATKDTPVNAYLLNGSFALSADFPEKEEEG